MARRAEGLAGMPYLLGLRLARLRPAHFAVTRPNGAEQSPKGLLLAEQFAHPVQDLILIQASDHRCWISVHTVNNGLTVWRSKGREMYYIFQASGVSLAPKPLVVFMNALSFSGSLFRTRSSRTPARNLFSLWAVSSLHQLGYFNTRTAR